MKTITCDACGLQAPERDSAFFGRLELANGVASVGDPEGYDLCLKCTSTMATEIRRAAQRRTEKNVTA